MPVPDILHFSFIISHFSLGRASCSTRTNGDVSEAPSGNRTGQRRSWPSTDNANSPSQAGKFEADVSMIRSGPIFPTEIFCPPTKS